MGKFDGILLCSDWDGTLFDGTSIPENNVEAIRYFQRNGGTFTLSSGRYAGHFTMLSFNQRGGKIPDLRYNGERKTA